MTGAAGWEKTADGGVGARNDVGARGAATGTIPGESRPSNISSPRRVLRNGIPLPPSSDGADHRAGDSALTTCDTQFDAACPDELGVYTPPMKQIQRRFLYPAMVLGAGATTAGLAP